MSTTYTVANVFFCLFNKSSLFYVYQSLFVLFRTARIRNFIVLFFYLFYFIIDAAAES